MSKTIPQTALLLILMILCAGCPDDSGNEQKQKVFNQKSAEALETMKLADFFLEEEYYIGARDCYEEAKKTAMLALSYKKDDKEMTGLIAKVDTKINCRRIIEGCKGHILIDGEWRKPEDCLKKRIDEINKGMEKEERAALIEQINAQWETLPDEINLLPGDLEQTLEAESAKKILAAGIKAVPILLEKIDSDNYFDQIAALHILLNIPDENDTIFYTILYYLKSDTYTEKIMCAAAAQKFPRKSTTAALIELLSDKRTELVNQAARSIIHLESPLGRHMLIEKLKEPRVSISVKEQILLNFHLYDNKEAVDVLVTAVQVDKKELVEAAAHSLIKLQSEKIPGALTTVLERAKKLYISDADLLEKMIKRIGSSKYKEAVTILAATFRNRSLDIEVRRAAIEALADIGDDKAVVLLSDLVYETEDKHENLWIEVAHALKRLKKPSIVKKFIDNLKSSSPKAVTRAAYVLGQFEEETALKPLRRAYVRNNKTTPRSTILNSMARIGSNAAINEIFRIIKTENPIKIPDYIDGFLKNMLREQDFVILIRKLDEDCPAEIRNLILASVKTNPPPLALSPLLAATGSAKFSLDLKFGAIGALKSYSEEMNDDQKKKLLTFIKMNLLALARKPAPDIFELAFNSVVEHDDPSLLKFFIDLLKGKMGGDNWMLRYLAARYLNVSARRGFLDIEPHRKELAGLCRKAAKDKDFLIALELVAYTGAFKNIEKQNIEKQLQAEAERVLNPENHPVRERLGKPLSRILELLGNKFNEVAPPESIPGNENVSNRFIFLHFPGPGILLMVRKETEDVIAVVYLPNFRGKLYGIGIGDSVNSVLRMVGSRGVRYVSEYSSYVIDIPDEHRPDVTKKTIATAIKENDEGKIIIDYILEILPQDAEEEDLGALLRIVRELSEQD